MTSIAIAIVGRAITLFSPTVSLAYLDYCIEEHGFLVLWVKLGLKQAS